MDMVNFGKSMVSLKVTYIHGRFCILYIGIPQHAVGFHCSPGPRRSPPVPFGPLRTCNCPQDQAGQELCSLVAVCRSPLSCGGTWQHGGVPWICPLQLKLRTGKITLNTATHIMWLLPLASSFGTIGGCIIPRSNIPHTNLPTN